MLHFSLLMSIYSKTESVYLDEAMTSIWTTQKLKPTELVIVYDGNVCKSVETVLDKWRNTLKGKLIEVRLENNVGLARALNEGLKKCNYELIARMDDDDFSLPDRFLMQVSYMEAHPEIAVLGTQVEECSQDLSYVLMQKKLPTEPSDLIRFSKYRCPINHPSVIFRKSVITKLGGYPIIYPEDFPLWAKVIVHGYKVANLPQVLMQMRQEEAIYQRRGRKFLIGELKMFKYMYQIGHLTFVQFVLNCLNRSIIRLSPNLIKKMLYKVMR